MFVTVVAACVSFALSALFTNAQPVRITLDANQHRTRLAAPTAWMLSCIVRAATRARDTIAYTTTGLRHWLVAPYASTMFDAAVRTFNSPMERPSNTRGPATGALSRHKLPRVANCTELLVAVHTRCLADKSAASIAVAPSLQVKAHELSRISRTKR